MKGFVVINTVFIISLIALIVLTMQNSLQLDMRIVSQLTNAHHAFHELEQTAMQVINDFNPSKSSIKCYTEESFSYLDITKFGCHDLSSNIYYTIKDLGEFPCLRSYQNGKSLSTHHYLLNIVNNKIHSRVLQIRYVLLGNNSECYNASPRYVAKGVLSWFY